ncbi:hypothetical protein FQN54_009550 [Arachnomyces sp. PD_36]|nr:hypothetical protein FQN54_009550 [Arachnomyces sp. PD_36]
MAFNYSKDNLPKKLFINNEFVDAKGTEKLSVYNPNDGSLVADDVAVADEQDVEAAVAAAEKAFPEWRKTTPNQRRDLLQKLASLIEEHAEAMSELTRITLGDPQSSMGMFQIVISTEVIRYNAGWVDKFAGESFPQEDGFLKIVRNEPFGVTAGIIPWNIPLPSAVMKLAPAVGTGNVIILKPSEKTPFAALALGALIKEAGFPPGVVQVLSGGGSTGALLAKHMKIRKVSFTGSVITGRKVQEMAIKSNMKRVTLELGGKSPAVIFDDANLDNAVKWAADSMTMNTGQACVAPSRVYVQEGVYDKFLEKYKLAMEEKKKIIGDPTAKGTLVGPLVDQIQFDRVQGFIERGKKGEGKLLTGGNRIGDKGYFVEPTIFTDVDPNAEIHTQEIFGPVSVVGKFKTEEEIIAIANDTTYGLMAGVFTQDINRALRVASDFESGMVGINCISNLPLLTTPFGGYKESGLGRECGIDGLRAFTERKTIMINMTY